MGFSIVLGSSYSTCENNKWQNLTKFNKHAINIIFLTGKRGSKPYFYIYVFIFSNTDEIHAYILCGTEAYDILL